MAWLAGFLWCAVAVADPQRVVGRLPAMDPADSLVVEKAKRELRVYRAGRVIQVSRIALGEAPRGDKRCEGDRKTPEGRYRIDFRNDRSLYHRSLRIGYPSAVDRREAKAAGCAPGGDIMLHGLPEGMGRWGARALQSDWTWGCVALTDDGIDSVWKVARVGTLVVIRP